MANLGFDHGEPGDPAAAHNAPARRARVVLIVDDDEAERLAAAAHLRELRFDVAEARSLEEALRILIVEDEFLRAETVVTALEKAGCEVVGPAARCGQAVELAERGGFDVALLDINLHGETCYPAAWLLMEQGVPFAFMTAYS